jgi:hypothetical protein
MPRPLLRNPDLSVPARAALLGLTLLCAAAPARASGGCEQAARVAERDFGLPAGVLGAIGRVESGRADPLTGRVSATPFAIDADGTALFPASAAEAVGQVRALAARGVRSIDVGCFQMSLLYHPAAFATLDQAFDPAANAHAAAAFLARLHAASGDWGDAIARYHSADPARGRPYRAAVLAAWHGGGTTVARGPARVPGLVFAGVQVFVPGGAPAAARAGLPRVFTP